MLKNRREGSIKILILLALLSLFIYSNTFSNPFLFDDLPNIAGNLKIQDPANFLDLSGTRPVGFLSFALNYHFGGLNVFGYHLVNLLIHIANGFLVYTLVLLLLRAANCEPRASWIALATALLFVVHPIQTQAVAYVVQRFSSLVALFYLLAVVGYLKWRLADNSPHPPLKLRGGERGRYVIWYVASLVSCVLAMKTKENAFTLPLAILLTEGIFFRAIRGARVAPSSGKATWSLPLNGPSGLVRWLALIPFLLTLLIVPLSYYQGLPEAEALTRQDVPDLKPMEYLFTQFRVIVTYLRLLVFPAGQSLDYDYPLYRSLFDPAVFLSFLFLAALLALAVKLMRPMGPMRLIAFGIFWFFLTLSFESSIAPVKDVINEHRVYLPSAGFFLAVCSLAALARERWKGMRIPLVLLMSVLIAGFSLAAHQRNRVWRDPITFWEDVARKAPNKARGHNNLGEAYRDGGRLNEAAREYREALRLQPVYPPTVYGNLGVVYKMQGRLDDAIREYQTALKLNPDDAEIRNNLGVAYRDQGRTEEAIAEFQAALRLHSKYPVGVHGNLAFAYHHAGRLDEAIREYEAAIRLNPDFAEARYNLGLAYQAKGLIKEARGEFEEALRIKPDFLKARQTLESLR